MAMSFEFIHSAALTGAATASQHTTFPGLTYTPCDASLSAIITDMPTMPAAIATRTMTDSCTIGLPFSLSKPFFSAMTDFTYWAMDVTEEMNHWVDVCDPDTVRLAELVGPFNVGDADCSDVWLVFSDSASTTSMLAETAFGNMGEESVRPSATDATTTPASAATSETGTNTVPQTGTSTMQSSGASESAAASTGTGDNDSGAVLVGAVGVFAASVAGVLAAANVF